MEQVGNVNLPTESTFLSYPLNFPYEGQHIPLTKLLFSVTRMNAVQRLHLLTARVVTRSIATRNRSIASSSWEVNNGLATSVLRQKGSVLNQTTRYPFSGSTPSTVHPALASVYKPGGVLTQGNRATRIRRLHDPQLPDWGPWGISIALSAAKVGSKQFVMTL